MERGVAENKMIQVDVQTLSALVSRMNFASRLGNQYNGSRDIYQALGYKKIITYEDYVARYERQDIAGAVINKPVDATWLGKLDIIETENKEDTKFEKEWSELEDKFKLKSIFSRADKLTGLGRYGCILLGLDDITDSTIFATPVRGKRKLIYLMPLGEGSAKITKYVTDAKDPRFGKPLIYDVVVQQTEGGDIANIQVHYTRIIHIVDNPLESDIEGTPRLEPVFNRLMDLEKLVGGDAEMFWRGARPGYSGKVDKDFMMNSKTKKDLQEQVDEYENNLRRILINEGIDLQALAQQIADPINHVDIQIQMISARTNIPKRILVGSERGELSSAQDSSEWKTIIQGRREDHAELHILRPFIDRCIELGILSKPSTGKYVVRWSDLFAMSENDRVTMGLNRSTAIRNYTTSPAAEAILPPDAFRKFCLGLKEDQIDEINQMVDHDMRLEDSLSQQDGQQSADNSLIEQQTQLPVTKQRIITRG